MGDRSNIGIRQNDNILFIYGHWMGEKNTTDSLFVALSASRERWNDTGYATRIAVSHVIGSEWEGCLGWGLYINQIGDNNGYVIPVINFERQIIEIFTEPASGVDYKEHFSQPIGQFTFDEYLDKMAVEIWDNALASRNV